MSNNLKHDKWKPSDYVKLTLLYLGQAVFLLFFMLIATFLKAGSFNALFEVIKTKFQIRETAFILVAMALINVVILFYFFGDDRSFIRKPSNVVMLFAIIDITLIACYLFSLLDMYLRPFALCALLSLFLINKRTALFLNFVFCLLMFLCDMLLLNLDLYNIEIYVMLVINFLSGMFALAIVNGECSRLKFLLKGFVIAIPSVLCVLCLEFKADVAFMLTLFGKTLLGALISDILTVVLLPVYEYVFQILTNFRLAELTDHNAKLIKVLQERAPGTFNHTVTVAMLAESCSNAIGENPLLARACAYYHDIGKIKKPDFFTENQDGRNPHNELTPELSADIIRAHAKDGHDLILKARLPEVLADTAEQHHGTMPIRYFYSKALKFNDGEVNINDYSYYGPKPQTKINAIIMICDASEASVRSVGNRTHENVDKAVKEIIEERMDMEQLSECDLTLKELDIIRNTITNTLAGVYHSRVKYPKLKTRR